tara:strand:- start:588 stop:773 length:186 start_codon:yes stop_codon:yes gene_type:complete
MKDSTEIQAFPDERNFGISIRDYFAARALQGFLTGDYDLYPHEAAQKAYAFADEMLKAREE